MNYALEIEREIGNNSSVAISYIGSQGRKLGIYLDVNEPFVNAIDSTRRGDQTPNIRFFPFNQYAGISMGTTRASSNYNAMVLTYK